MKYTLTYDRCNETGELGFRIEGLRNFGGAFMATEGNLIAHDIIEHSNIKEIGTIGDELKAFGAIWYVRGQLGEIRRDRVGSALSAEENVSYDLVEMGRMVILEGKKYGMPTPKVYLEACPVIESFRRIADIVRKGIRSELEHEKYTTDALYKYLDTMVRFLVYGYQCAARRYERIGGCYQANNLYWAVADAVDKALKWAELEGQQFVLHVVASQKKAYVKELHTQEW